MTDFLAALDLVAARLNGTDPKVSANLDPSKVNVPGAWVDFTGRVSHTTLDGDLVEVEVTIIVRNNARRTALADLQTLYDRVVAELGTPDGDVRKQSTVLPDSPTGCPSLVLPYLVAT